MRLFQVSVFFGQISEPSLSYVILVYSCSLFGKDWHQTAFGLVRARASFW